MRNFILLHLFYFLSTSFVFAQHRKIDSLFQVLRKAKFDTNKVKILNALTTTHFPNYQKALPFAEEAKFLSEKLFYKQGTAVAYRNLGTIYAYFGIYDKSFDNYLNELKIWDALKDTEMIILSNNHLADIYSAQGNYEKALELSLMGEKIVLRTGNKEKIARALWKVSGRYLNICKQAILKEDSILANYNYDKAVDCLSKALEIYKNSNDTNAIAFFLTNLAFALDKCNLYKEPQLAAKIDLIKSSYFEVALEHYLKALQLYKKTNDMEGVAWSFSNIGLFYKNQGNLFNQRGKLPQANINYEKSLENYIKSFNQIKMLGYKHGKANGNKDVGIAFLKLGKLYTAEKYLQNAANGFKEIGYNEGAKESYEMLYEVSLKKLDYKKAYDFFRDYSALKDSLLNEDTKKKLAELSIKYESEKKDQEILLLNKDKEVKDGKIKQQSKKIILIASFAASLLLATAIIFLLYQRRRAKYNLKVQQMDNKFLRFQLKPHFVKNALAAIRKYIRLYPELAEEYFDKYSNLMKDVLIHSEKEKISLEEELSMLKKYMDLESLRLSNGFNYVVNIDSSINDEVVKVPPLILQPIVENAVWHGIAGRKEKGKISIYVSLENKVLRCVVENHCGGSQRVEIEDVKKGKSFGLQISRERLKLLSKEKRSQWFLETTPKTDGLKVQLGIPI